MKSRYSPDKDVTYAQYITEIICENKAFSEQKELPLQFWGIKKWANYFKWQITMAHDFVKKYEPDVIIRVLRNNKSIYSFKNKYLHVLLQKEKRRIRSLDTPKVVSTLEKPQILEKQSVISRLREIE